jgi:hypothetical protein
MTFEAKVTLTASGTFFLAALLTGVWKYRHMRGHRQSAA